MKNYSICGRELYGHWVRVTDDVASSDFKRITTFSSLLNRGIRKRGVGKLGSRIILHGALKLCRSGVPLLPLMSNVRYHHATFMDANFPRQIYGKAKTPLVTTMTPNSALRQTRRWQRSGTHCVPLEDCRLGANAGQQRPNSSFEPTPLCGAA
jgi:hypothetical protein